MTSKEELLNKLMGTEGCWSACDYVDFIIQREKDLMDKALSTKFTYCAYCGEEFAINDGDAKDRVTKHIHECPKHPIADYKAKIVELLVSQKSMLYEIERPLVSITEYWNRAENSSAMSDALYHNIDMAKEALSVIEKMRGEK